MFSAIEAPASWWAVPPAAGVLEGEGRRAAVGFMRVSCLLSFLLAHTAATFFRWWI